MSVLLKIILIALDIYIYVIIATAVLSGLLAFNMVNPHSPFVTIALKFLHRLTDPVLLRMRTAVPALGNVYISLLILFVIIIMIQRVIVSYIYPLVS